MDEGLKEYKGRVESKGRVLQGGRMLRDKSWSKESVKRKTIQARDSRWISEYKSCQATVGGQAHDLMRCGREFG